MLCIDVLVAEIGSTTTVVNAFSDLDKPHPMFLGQGIAPTTVSSGDVTSGLEQAVRDLEGNLGSRIRWKRMIASSSAAGGLKMTVHGLVYDMTAKAAKEAALGAGAVVHMVTAGIMSNHDLKRMIDIRPNIILLAGGVDYGERATAVANAKAISALGMRTPIIYAGNIAAQDEIKEIFREKAQVHMADNVYPGIDTLMIEPTRKIIREVFEKHIVNAPGMETIRDMVDGPIAPTPGAVMDAAQLLGDEIGDLLVVDIGGATTDVHSVTEGADEIQKVLIAPEPRVKRTVEGDLGVYINRYRAMEEVDPVKIQGQLGIDVKEALAALPSIPVTSAEIRLVEYLAKTAATIAVMRHAGEIRQNYGPSGRYTVAEGKDLTQVEWIIGTGGALSRLPHGREILQDLSRRNRPTKLLPPKAAKILIDYRYIMAALGVLSREYPKAAVALLKQSLK